MAVKEKTVKEKRDTVRRLEMAVMQNRVEEAKQIITEENPEFCARSLGLACRYAGPKMVQTLIYLGVTFKYEQSRIMSVRYGTCGTDYWRYLIQSFEEAYSRRNFPHLNNCPRTRIPEDERVAVTELLVKHGVIDPQDILYHAILNSDYTVAHALYRLGVRKLSDFRNTVVDGSVEYSHYNSWKRGEKDAFTYTVKQAGDQELLKMLTAFLDIIPAERILLYPKILYDDRGNFIKRYCSPTLFPLFLEHTDLTDRISKVKLTLALLEQNNAEGLGYALGNGWVKRREECEYLFRKAQDNRSIDPGITALLLAQLNRYESGELSDLSLDESNIASDLRKIWCTKKLENGQLMITSYKGFETNVVIPAKIDGHTVSMIDPKAFWPEATANLIQRDARQRITSIEFPGSIRKIPDGMFYKDYSWRNKYRMNQLRRVILNEGTKYIGRDAFRDCEGLETVTVPKSLRYIGKNAFAGCTNLRKVPTV